VFDVDKAVQYLDSHAQPKSKGKCATYVANAISNPAAGGQPMATTLAAKDFGPDLEAAGFREVTDGSLQKGDVAVIQSIPGHPYGHMTMFDGESWVSDFNQGSSMYPGAGYRAAQPPYKIYRHSGASSSGSGVHAITQHGKKVKGTPHGVFVGPKKRRLSHQHAELEGGGEVTQGSPTVFVGPERYAVARVEDQTTDAPIAVGEDSVLVG
jgi:hypothetical protein